MSDPVMLVDLSALFAANWYATVNTGDPTLARAATIEAVEREASKHETIICLDSPTSWRRDLSPEYKANREVKPPEFIREMQATQGALAIAGHTLAHAVGHEADDVIATLCARLRAAGRSVVVASADKDLYQLLEEQVTMLSTRDGKTIEAVDCVTKFGVRPDQIRDYLALVGDASDNVKGVKGVGPKRAADLLAKHGSIDNIYRAMERGEQVATPAIVTALAESWDVVALARQLVTLRTDAPIEFIGEKTEAAPVMVAAPVETAKEERVTMALPAKQAATGGRLGAVKRGKVSLAQRVLIYGGEGTGKSTLASGAPDPIWLDIEGGSIHLDVARYTWNDGPMGHVPATYEQVLSALDELVNTQHGFKTVVIDTADKLESLIWAHVVAEAKNSQITSIEDFGFGKGYVAALDTWRDLIKRLDDLRSRNIHVILIAHAQIKPFRNPTGDDFDRWQLRCHDKAGGLLKDWADVVGFMVHDEWVKKDKNAPRAKGFSSGKRMLMTERTAAYDAKSRLPLPKEIEIDIGNPWAPIAAALAAVSEANPDDLLAQIETELVRIGDEETATKARAACEVAKSKGDVAALSRYLQTLKGREAKTSTTESTQAA